MGFAFDVIQNKSNYVMRLLCVYYKFIWCNQSMHGFMDTIQAATLLAMKLDVTAPCDASKTQDLLTNLLQLKSSTSSSKRTSTHSRWADPAPQSNRLRVALHNWGMGGITHTNRDINCGKWFQAVAAWVQFEVDLILFSEMQPSEATSDTPDAPYILEYNAEPKRMPGKGTGAAFNRSLLESSTKLYIPDAPKQCGFWIIHLPSTSIIVGAWYGPVNSNNTTIVACIA